MFPFPPLPPGPPPNFDGQYGRDSWRPPPAPLPQSEFSFRNSNGFPQYPQQSNSYRPSQPSDNYRNRQPQSRSGRYEGHYSCANGDRSRGRPFRGRRDRILPSDRPLLQQQNGQNSEEQTLGVDAKSQKFASLDDLSDSSEEQMEMSDSDKACDEEPDGMQEDGEIEQRPAKRRALNADVGADLDEIPRWSNPDPYSVLPPVDENVRKRKDPVKFIRKAFKSVEQSTPTQNQVSANVDFISFEDDDQESTSTPEPEQFPIPEGKVFLDLGDNAEIAEFTYKYDGHANHNGSRKRTYDDVIESDSRPAWVSAAHPDGSILEEWVPRTAADAVPWLDADTAMVKKAAFKLHREICDFYEYVKPQDFEQVVREDLLSRLRTAVAREFPGCEYSLPRFLTRI